LTAKPPPPPPEEQAPKTKKPADTARRSAPFGISITPPISQAMENATSMPMPVAYYKGVILATIISSAGQQQASPEVHAAGRI
jgi:hypothetical protein